MAKYLYPAQAMSLRVDRIPAIQLGNPAPNFANITTAKTRQSLRLITLAISINHVLLRGSSSASCVMTCWGSFDVEVSLNGIPFHPYLEANRHEAK